MRHAYLILVHNNWSQLRRLMSLLDSENADIFVHVDQRAKGFEQKFFDGTCKCSRVKFYRKYRNYWGSYRLVQSELYLIEKAIQGNYDYYHLLSGADLPIKSVNTIEKFFECNKGKEFIHFDTDERLANDKEIWRRTALFHFLQNFRKRYRNNVLNNCATFIEHCLLGIQIIFHIDRLRGKDVKIYYGSQWFSITRNFALYVLEQKEIIDDLFRKTSCSDELVMQTIVMKSPFKENLYVRERSNKCESNMRLIDWERGKKGSPYVWNLNDIERLRKSDCLFARKFSSDFPMKIIKSLMDYGEY